MEQHNENEDYAAATVNAVGSLMDAALNGSGMERAQIAQSMGVSSERLHEILYGDGNVRVSTLARLMHATGYTLTMSIHKDGKDSIVTDSTITVPRTTRRTR